jgi:hypothetical protein
MVIAALVLGISATTGGIVYAAAAAPIAGSPTVAAQHSPTTAAPRFPATAPTSGSQSNPVDDKALQADKIAATGPHSSAARPRGGGILADPRAAGLVAANLGVSTAAAQRALDALIPLASAKGGLDPHSAGFQAIATNLGVSAQRLGEAIDALKRGMG